MSGHHDDSEGYDKRPDADEHPEANCHRCGGPNVTWSAPSPLWNEVMRGGDIDGLWLWDEIICPTCFAVLAEEAGIAHMWRLSAQEVYCTLQTVTPSGRTWNATTWLWDDRRPAAEAGRADDDGGDVLDLDAVRAHLALLTDHPEQWRAHGTDDAMTALMELTLTDVPALLAELDKERRTIAILTGTDDMLTAFAEQERDEARAQLAEVIRERDEARAKAVDGGEWVWFYGFLSAADGKFVHHGDEVQARSLAHVLRLPVHRQRVWLGTVEPVTDDGSGT